MRPSRATWPRTRTVWSRLRPSLRSSSTCWGPAWGVQGLQGEANGGLPSPLLSSLPFLMQSQASAPQDGIFLPLRCQNTLAVVPQLWQVPCVSPSWTPSLEEVRNGGGGVLDSQRGGKVASSRPGTGSSAEQNPPRHLEA
jgi:hypothetical protein